MNAFLALELRLILPLLSLSQDTHLARIAELELVLVAGYVGYAYVGYVGADARTGGAGEVEDVELLAFLLRGAARSWAATTVPSLRVYVLTCTVFCASVRDVAHSKKMAANAIDNSDVGSRILLLNILSASPLRLRIGDGSLLIHFA